MIELHHIREQFIRAGREFGFHFISSYCLDEKTGLTAFGYLYGNDRENGRVIEVLFSETPGVIKWCREHDLFFSIINPEILSGEYDCSVFAEMIEDWKYDV